MDNLSLDKSFICGGVGGVFDTLASHPFDTLKVRLQTMPVPPPGEKPKYKGAIDCAIKTIKREGFLGLYKGVTAPLSIVTPIYAVCFFSFSLGKLLLEPHDNDQLIYTKVFLAGAFAGTLTTVFTAPSERIAVLLQIQNGIVTKKYNGMLDCAQQIWKKNKLRGIYKGALATLLRDGPAFGVYFCTFEGLLHQIKIRTGQESNNFFPTILVGGMSGISYCLIAMPMDVLKTRMQTSPDCKYPHGIRSVFRELMKTDGVLGLYRGLIPAMMASFPANIACIAGLEICKGII